MAEKRLVGVSKTLRNNYLWSDTKDNFDSAGVAVDDGVYDTGGFEDRDYDVRGLSHISIDLENTGANSIDYTLLGATKPFTKISELVDADYHLAEVAETALAGTTRVAIYDETLTSRITALRLRAKETTPTSDSTLRGDVNAR